MFTLLDKFKLSSEKEKLETVVENIESGIVFRGTNLWILIFAIFVASLGLNINSAAVIIGAMLISPLMGPIMGVGLGMGINDLQLLKQSLNNYLIATGVALTTSTLFFFISPLDDAHSEILARTSPNIYDVLIALFGGFAGIIATSSKLKGNVIPGVAIATALMPPLCTAGYGLATLQLRFFVGAFYLYLINTVFIALATFIIVRLLHFPYKSLKNERAEKMARRVVWLVVLITLLPSIYFGYDLVQQTKFIKSANNFVAAEAHFDNDYLLNKKIDPKEKVIELVFGGDSIDSAEIQRVQDQLPKYELKGTKLIINQGFAYLAKDTKPDEETEKLNKVLEAKDRQEKIMIAKLDSIANIKKASAQVFEELKVQYPSIQNGIIEPTTVFSDSAKMQPTFLVLLEIKGNISTVDRNKIENWLKVRMRQENIKLLIQR